MHICTYTHTHTHKLSIYKVAGCVLSKKYKMLQETRKGLVLAGKIRGCVIKEMTYKSGT